MSDPTYQRLSLRLVGFVGDTVRMAVFFTLLGIAVWQETLWPLVGMVVWPIAESLGVFRESATRQVVTEASNQDRGQSDA